MSICSMEDLITHSGHEIEIVYYGEENDPGCVCIECNTCGVVLVDMDQERNVLNVDMHPDCGLEHGLAESARNAAGSSDENVTFDGDAPLSVGDDGVNVQAWVWVAAEDIPGWPAPDDEESCESTPALCAG
ncbi:MAG: hypothetical protein KKB70_05260 [Proteobacteria bacterium]|nr:hypothetical protein [Pseudomonadota bacterium]